MRFIKRGEDGQKDNAVASILTTDGIAFFKQDTIYEIIEVFGELLIKEVGKTHMDRSKWNREIQSVMLSEKPWCTEQEMEIIETADS